MLGITRVDGQVGLATGVHPKDEGVAAGGRGAEIERQARVILLNAVQYEWQTGLAKDLSLRAT